MPDHPHPIDGDDGRSDDHRSDHGGRDSADHGRTGGDEGDCGSDTASVEALAGMPPGPELAAALAHVDISCVSAYDLVTVIKAVERQKAHTDALQVRAFAELAGRGEYQRCSCPTDNDEAPHVHRAVDPASDEISLALRCSKGRATHQVLTATDLTTELPDTLTALTEGRIDADKARLIAERTRCLATAERRRRVEAVVLPVAERCTRGQVDYRLRQEVIAADPEGAEERRRRARKGRRVDPPVPATHGGEDGMAAMSLYGPAEDLTAFWIAIDAAARHAREMNKTTNSSSSSSDGNSNVGVGVGDGDGDGDERTLDQLRFDLLTGLGWTALDTGHLGCCNPQCTDATTEPGAGAASAATASHTGTSTTTASGAAPAGTAGAAGRPGGDPADAGGASAPQPPPAAPPGSGRVPGVMRLGKRRGKAATVNVTVPITTLAGVDHQPGWLDGYGPITADTARRVTAEGTLKRMLTDPVDGRLLEYGRSTYAPPAELAAFVVARDRTCRFPTCPRTASEAEIDHKIPYGQGGTTGASNTWALHKGHHLGKTHHGYSIHTDRDGVTWWTTPAGHTYRVEPEIIGPLNLHTAPDAATGQQPTPAGTAAKPAAGTADDSITDLPPF